jgi:hypothetical protein
VAVGIRLAAIGVELGIGDDVGVSVRTIIAAVGVREASLTTSVGIGTVGVDVAGTRVQAKQASRQPNTEKMKIRLTIRLRISIFNPSSRLYRTNAHKVHYRHANRNFFPPIFNPTVSLRNPA